MSGLLKRKHEYWRKSLYCKTTIFFLELLQHFDFKLFTSDIHRLEAVIN